MTNRNELERLLAAAAEGPWEAIGTDSVEGRDWCWLKAQPNSVICVFTKGTGAINGSQSDPMPQANAALTCFLRNNAQHYLSLMDEVERLREALGRIAAPLDCGCRPCRGSCRSETALSIELEERQDVARQALGETHDR